MDQRDIVAEDTQLPRRCGAMIQQRDAQALPSSPQQFVRLVGGYRRPAPTEDTQAPDGTLTE